MARSITIDPVTRIEGHARVEVEVDDANTITSSVFKVMDFRGWETFLRGMQVEMMPTITSRICGTCSGSHHLVAARAVDQVFGVTPPRAAWLVRETFNLSHYIHSHAIHFFALAAPDFLMGLEADPATRNIVGIVKLMPEVAAKALRLRSIGQKVTELIGGRGTHPVSFVPGGMAAPLDRSSREVLIKMADEALTLARELYPLAKNALIQKQELLYSLPMETYYLGTVREGALEAMDGTLRLRAPDGNFMEFSEDDWAAHLFEETNPNSYAKSVFCRINDVDAIPFRVGPLARVNCCDYIDTPSANEELLELRETGGWPCHQTVFYHWARLIELLYAAEKLALVARDEELFSDQVRAKPNAPRPGRAHVEAPRGVLIHDYTVNESGLVTDVNLLVATQMNVPAINATVGMSAQQYIDQPDSLLLNAIEFGVRCYDPCLSCATHRLGEMKLEVTITRRGELIRHARR